MKVEVKREERSKMEIKIQTHSQRRYICREMDTKEFESQSGRAEI
jgi:hypothetical protein